MKSNIIICTLCTVGIEEVRLRGSREVGAGIVIECDQDRIRCVLLKEGEVGSEDVGRCTEAMMAFLRGGRLELEPELDLYVSGDFIVRRVSLIEEAAERAWDQFFSGWSEKIVYSSEKRCFVRVQGVVKRVEQLV